MLKIWNRQRKGELVREGKSGVWNEKRNVWRVKEAAYGQDSVCFLRELRASADAHARHGRHAKLTLYRDAAGSKEDVTLYVFGNDLEACFKR